MPVGVFFGWMALSVWAVIAPETGAAGLALGDAAALLGPGEAPPGAPVEGLGEGLAAGEGDGEADVDWLAAGWGDVLGEGCCATGAAVQATIQTRSRPARRARRRCGIPARIMCAASGRGSGDAPEERATREKGPGASHRPREPPS